MSEAKRMSDEDVEEAWGISSPDDLEKLEADHLRARSAEAALTAELASLRAQLAEVREAAERHERSAEAIEANARNPNRPNIGCTVEECLEAANAERRIADAIRAALSSPASSGVEREDAAAILGQPDLRKSRYPTAKKLRQCASGVEREEEPKAGLRAEVADGELRIRIGVKTLAVAFNESEFAKLYDEAAGDFVQRFRVTDPEQFACEVARVLQDEEEDGTTKLHELFDAACEAVVEDGGDGVDEVWPPAPGKDER